MNPSNHLCNKPGTRKSHGEKVVKDIRRATRKQYSAEEKIRIVLDGLKGEDSIAGVTSTSQKELEVGAKRNTEIIARVLEPYSSAIENCDLTVDQYADFIQRSSTAAKYSAMNKKHLIELLSALRMSALKVTSSA